ncbi:MAG: (Fe-S)-binding protein [Gemmatimonadota bacterium]|nr:(Fe-S)-binding protein [Gemmatimonadota bacterium]
MKVALFVTCLADHYFAEAGADAVRLLRHLGCEVSFPTAQTCCGQPAHNAGMAEEALEMAKHTSRVLEDAEHVVVPSGSCAAMIAKAYPALGLGGGLASRTWELGAFLRRQLGVTRLGPGLEGKRVAYHQGCHALRELGLETEPIELLEGAGAQVVDWPSATECCGFGGLFSTKMPTVSAAMADAKLDTLPYVDWVVSGDPGCLLQLSSRARRTGSDTRFRHLASVLWEAADGGA